MNSIRRMPSSDVDGSSRLMGLAAHETCRKSSSVRRASDARMCVLVNTVMLNETKSGRGDGVWGMDTSKFELPKTSTKQRSTLGVCARLNVQSNLLAFVYDELSPSTCQVCPASPGRGETWKRLGTLRYHINVLARRTRGKPPPQTPSRMLLRSTRKLGLRQPPSPESSDCRDRICGR